MQTFDFDQNNDVYALISQTLLTISENLLREPDNPKFRSFKPTNTIVKKNLIDPKCDSTDQGLHWPDILHLRGTVEYAREVSCSRFDFVECNPDVLSWASILTQAPPSSLAPHAVT
jgi:hypothetical protein